MDGHRFDELTRALARGTSRRTVLKGMIGGVAGGIAATFARSDASARRITQADCGNMTCADDPSVCNDGCVCCGFSNGNSRCMPPQSCRRSRGEIMDCSPGETSCDDSCVDIDDDINNCGDCGQVCPGPTAGSCQREAICENGRCGYRTATSDTICRDATCIAGQAVPATYCDGSSLECPPPAAGTACPESYCSDTTEATTYACQGAGECVRSVHNCGLTLCVDGACPGGCDDDNDCVGAAHCEAGVCQGDNANGGSCDSGEDCVSGHCVSGVCCDAVCDGACHSCASGSCEVTTGDPCGGGAGVCAGTCDAGECVYPGAEIICGGEGACAATCQGGACVYPGEETECDYAECVGGSVLEQSVCNGGGGCITHQTDCAPYTCRCTTQNCGGSSCCVGACTTSCSETQPGCADDAYCDDSGVCREERSNGDDCTTNEECGSGICTSGVCCDTACDGVCHSCTTGTCESTTGGTCGEGSGACDTGTCDSGECVYPADGTGCGGTGYCAGTCNGGHCVYPGAEQICTGVGECAGTCDNGECVSPADGTACGGTGECAGTCQGGLCVYAPEGTICENTGCSDDGLQKVEFKTCDGQGGCTVENEKPCAPYGCTQYNYDCGDFVPPCWFGYCVAMCDPTSGAGCAFDAYCDNDETCHPRKAQGEDCAKDAECETGACASGVCCDSTCDGVCESCAVPGSAGTCTTLPAGTVCAGPTCDDGVTTQAICDGAGVCQSPTTENCGGAGCNGAGTGCAVSCTTSENCDEDHYCDGGECLPSKLAGDTCSNGEECYSGTCAGAQCVCGDEDDGVACAPDRVCCGGACCGEGGTCESGVCTVACLEIGEDCTSTGQCCLDGDTICFPDYRAATQSYHAGLPPGYGVDPSAQSCCRPFGASCTKDTDCCNSQHDIHGSSSYPVFCSPEGICGGAQAMCFSYSGQIGYACEDAFNCCAKYRLPPEGGFASECCADGEYCDPNGIGGCSKGVDNGDPCTEDRDCKSGVCTDSVCRDYCFGLADGTACVAAPATYPSWDKFAGDMCCGGTCVNRMNSDHCGTCDHACLGETEFCNYDYDNNVYYCPCTDNYGDGSCGEAFTGEFGHCRETAIGETCVIDAGCGAACDSDDDCADFGAVMGSPQLCDVEHDEFYQDDYLACSSKATCSLDPNYCPNQCVPVFTRRPPIPAIPNDQNQNPF